MPLSQYVYLIILGVIVGFMGLLYNYLLFKSQDLYAGQKWLPVQARPVIPFVVAGLLGLLLPEVLGGGNSLVNTLTTSGYTITFLVILFVGKLIFSMISYGSSAPGGIFLPLLVLGALVGVLYCKTLHGLLGYDETYAGSFMVLAMAGYFTAIVKAPITGIILITEMTGSFSNLLPTGVVCLTAYVITEVFKSKPIYESLLERFLHKGSYGYKPKAKNKMLLEVAVHSGSALEGKKVKEIQWPSHCLIVGIKRGAHEVIPNGGTVVYSGDYLMILTNEDTATHVRQSLTEVCERCTALSGTI
ncbi:chloride channel protein [Paenibacillus hexagrammi]|uniref:Chloride channel protein n=2 Tax=Paenibacillus hexagrammi TaxID=2908839 RepID=A0ABY3SQR4_9BACL|nr:chloride channel protein [Paenibacillus sp. YPD9-1]